MPHLPSISSSSSSSSLPLFKLEKLIQLRRDPYDECLEQRFSSSSSSSPTIAASAFVQIGDATLLALVTESSAVLLRHEDARRGGGSVAAAAPVVKELMWFRSGQLRVRCVCLDPTAAWLLAVTADARLYAVAALAGADGSSSGEERLSWPTDDLICVSEDLELEGRATKIVWWETTEGKRIAIVGSDARELIFVDLETRKSCLRLHLDFPVSDLELISNATRTQTSLLISFAVETGASPRPCLLLPPPQSRLVLEKCLQSAPVVVAHIFPGEGDEEIVRAFEGLCSVIHPRDPRLPPPQPQPVDEDGCGGVKRFAGQSVAGRPLLSALRRSDGTLELWEAESNRETPSTIRKAPGGLLAESVIVGEGVAFYVGTMRDDDEESWIVAAPCCLTDTEVPSGKELQRFRLPRDERIVSVHKTRYPFYYFDRNEEKAEEEVQSPLVTASGRSPSASASFGWSVPFLRFSLPSILDGCVVVTTDSVFRVSPRFSPERLVFELAQRQRMDVGEVAQRHDWTASLLAGALGVDPTPALEASREFDMSRDGVVAGSVSDSSSDSRRLARAFVNLLERGRHEEALALNAEPLVVDATFGLRKTPPSWLRRLLEDVDATDAGVEIARLYFETLVDVVLRHKLLGDRGDSHWSEAIVLDFADAEILSMEECVGVLLERGFEDAALSVSRSRRRFFEFLRLLETRGGGDGVLPWRRFLRCADLTRSEMWTLASFLAADRRRLVSAAAEDAAALFRLVTSSPASLAGNLDAAISLAEKAERRDLKKALEWMEGGSWEEEVMVGKEMWKKDAMTMKIICQILLGGKKEEEEEKREEEINEEEKEREERLQTCQNLQPTRDDRFKMAAIVKSTKLKPRRNSLAIGLSRFILVADAGNKTGVQFHSVKYSVAPQRNEYRSASSPPATPTLDAFAALRLRVSSISCGANHAVAIAGGVLLSWGDNRRGQIGVDGSLDGFVSSPTPILVAADGRSLDDPWASVACGSHHNLALTLNGAAYSWGWGVHGQLGHGDSADEALPKRIEFVDEKIESEAIVSAGHAHSTILLDGRLFTFGSNHFGQLGVGVGERKSVRPLRVDIEGERIVDVACGSFHTVVLSASSRIFSWGRHPMSLKAASRAVALSSTSAPRGGFVSPDDLKRHTLPSLVSTPPLMSLARRVFAGARHSALLTEDGEVYAWGANHDDQLSVGAAAAEVTRPRMVVALNDKKIVEIVAGAGVTLAVDDGGSVFVWGKEESTRHFDVFDKEKPVKMLKEKTFAKEKKRTRAEKRRAPHKAASRGDYPPAPIDPHDVLLVERLCSIHAGDFDLRRVLTLCLKMKKDTVAAELYWKTERRSLCLASLLHGAADESTAASIVRRHIDAIQSSASSEELSDAVGVAIIAWKERHFSFRALEEAFRAPGATLATMCAVVDRLRRLGAVADLNGVFSVEFLASIFLSVARNNDVALRSKEAALAATTPSIDSLWAAIRGNLERAAGEKKRIVLSSMELEALDSVRKGSSAMAASTRNSGGVYLFTCGHHFKTVELRQTTLGLGQPGLAALYDGMAERRTAGFACPECVAKSLRRAREGSF